MLKKAPFEPQLLEEERNPKDDKFTCRVNDKERAMIEEVKKIFDINSDSKALKFMAVWGFNVIQGWFSPKQLRFLFKKDRVKLSDYQNFEQ